MLSVIKCPLVDFFRLAYSFISRCSVLRIFFNIYIYIEYYLEKKTSSLIGPMAGLYWAPKYYALLPVNHPRNNLPIYFALYRRHPLNVPAVLNCPIDPSFLNVSRLNLKKKKQNLLLLLLMLLYWVKFNYKLKLLNYEILNFCPGQTNNRIKEFQVCWLWFVHRSPDKWIERYVGNFKWSDLIGSVLSLTNFS